MSDEYLIRRVGADSEGCAMWWRPHGRGYTTDIIDAGRYTRTEAEAIVRGSVGDNVAYPAVDVRRASHTVVRVWNEDVRVLVPLEVTP